MKIRLISASVAAIVAAWAPLASARDSVALPGVVTPEGVRNGVDTTGVGTLTIGNNQNINTNNDLAGAFRTSANDQGALLFIGNSTVVGSTGAIGTEFDSISAGAVGSTVNFNGKVFSRIINVSGTGTVNLNGDVIAAPNFAGDGFINLGANRMLTGAIITATANTGTLTLNGGSSITGAVGGASGLKRINVVGGNASISGAVQAQGFSLGANTLAIGGALTTNAGGTIASTLAGNSTFGKIVVGSSLVNAGGITVVPTVTGVLTSGTNFKVVESQSGTNGAIVSVLNNNPRYTFVGDPTVLGNVNIRLASVAPLATLVTAPGAAALAPILDVNAPAGSDLLTVQNAIAVLPTAAAINGALAQLAPGTTNLAAPRVAGQTARLFGDLWMARVDETHACDPDKAWAPDKARNCKAPEERSNWWGKGFGNWGSQGDIDNMSGYQSDAAGLMLAYDIPLNSETRVGLGGGYATTSIDGNNSSGNTKIDSYQFTGYLSHTPGPWFVKSALTIGSDRYDSSRPIEFQGVNRTAKADYRGQQYTGIVAAGRHFVFDTSTVVTPLASLQASRIHVGSYTEGGAGDLNLNVNSQDYNFVQSGLGVKVERVIQSANGTYSPEVHFKWLHEFTSTTPAQNAAFIGGGAGFTTQGLEQDRELFNVGTGISFASCNCGGNSWTVKGLYDYKWNQSSFSSHQVAVVASLKF
jgi:uncharacterized protein with beta-barrel porin domain